MFFHIATVYDMPTFADAIHSVWLYDVRHRRMHTEHQRMRRQRHLLQQRRQLLLLLH